MSTPPIGRRRRIYRILRLFYGLLFSFLFEYARARLAGRSYNFFADAERNRQRAIRIRTTALEMGGVLIKVGQFLSSRVDVLPPEYIEELSLLQDQVPPVPFEDIRAAAEAELGGHLEQFFSSFSPQPLAAASLGQVHLAVLLTGQHVAVKIQRPNIEAIVDADLQAVDEIIRLLDRFSVVRRRVNLRELMEEFEATLRLELDYLAEGHHAERIDVMFRDEPAIVVPRVYWSHSTARLLTLQYMWGTKVTDFDSLEDQGISRPGVAVILMRAYLRQVLEFGFFHADPHPGNIAVRPGPVVVLLDFGMVGEITPQMRQQIRAIFLGIIRRSFDEVVIAAERLGFVAPRANRAALREAIAWLVENFYGLSLEEMQQVDPRDVLNQLQDVLFSESLRVPSNFAFLGRALGTLVGLCTALDPTFQFVDVAEPFARNLIQGGGGVRGRLAFVGHEARLLGSTLYALPYTVQATLHEAGGWEQDITQRIDGTLQRIDVLEHTIRRIFYGLLVLIALFATTSIFRHSPLLSALALLLAAVLTLRAMIPRRRRR